MNRRDFLMSACKVGAFATLQPWKILELLDVTSPEDVARRLAEWNVPAQAATSITAAANPLTASSALTVHEVGSKRDFSCIGDGVTDDTANLQAFFNDLTGTDKVLEAGTYKYTTQLTLPAAGTRVRGIGSGGDFQSVLKPVDCQAFLFSGTHHCELSNFLIWPQGTSAPTTFITFQNTYNLLLSRIRMHIASTYIPSTRAILFQNSGGANLGVTLDNFILRSDGTYYPIGIEFGADCGMIDLTNCDLETCGSTIKHLGGNISITTLYTERAGAHVLYLNPSTDANASFTLYGGRLLADTGAYPIRLDDGCTNTNIDVGFVTIGGGGGQGFIYGSTGSTNVSVRVGNLCAANWGTVGTFNPKIYQFMGPGRPLPAAQFSTINVTTGALAANLITGAQFTHLTSTNATPGNQQSRTAAQMVSDSVNVLPGDAYHLRITQTGTNAFTLTTNTGMTLTGTMTVALNTFRDFVVTYVSLAAVTIQSIGTGTYSKLDNGEEIYLADADHRDPVLAAKLNALCCEQHAAYA
jgi:hypothetical protein